MSKLTTMAKLPILWFPEPWVKALIGSRLRHADGRDIDAKAQFLGELANALRGDALPSVEDSRAQMARLAALLDEPRPKSVNVQDLELPGGGGPRPARIYTPDGAGSQAMPTLFFIHGGGWMQCDLDTHDGLCGKLADWAGIRVISYHYRLAPEHPFPAGLDDVAAGYAAIRDRAVEFGIDLTRLAVGGDSAGGNLTAALMHVLQEQGGALPTAQLLLYPALDGRLESQSVQSLTDAFLLNHDRMLWYLSLYLDNQDDLLTPRVSPMFSDRLPGQPQAMVIVAGHDPLRDDGIAYVDALTSAGVKADLVEFPGQIHAFMSLTKVLPQGNAAIRQAADWLKTVLA